MESDLPWAAPLPFSTKQKGSTTGGPLLADPKHKQDSDEGSCLPSSSPAASVHIPYSCLQASVFGPAEKGFPGGGRIGGGNGTGKKDGRERRRRIRETRKNSTHMDGKRSGTRILLDGAQLDASAMEVEVVRGMPPIALVDQGGRGRRVEPLGRAEPVERGEDSGGVPHVTSGIPQCTNGVPTATEGAAEGAAEGAGQEAVAGAPKTSLELRLSRVCEAAERKGPYGASCGVPRGIPLPWEMQFLAPHVQAHVHKQLMSLASAYATNHMVSPWTHLLRPQKVSALASPLCSPPRLPDEASALAAYLPHAICTFTLCFTTHTLKDVQKFQPTSYYSFL